MKDNRMEKQFFCVCFNFYNTLYAIWSLHVRMRKLTIGLCNSASKTVPDNYQTWVQRCFRICTLDGCKNANWASTDMKFYGSVKVE